MNITSKIIIFSFIFSILSFSVPDDVQAFTRFDSNYGYSQISSQKLSLRERLLKKFREKNYSPKKSKKFNFLKNNKFKNKRFKNYFYKPVQNIQNSPQVYASIRPIRLSTNKNNLSQNNINVFNLGLRFKNPSRDFSPAVNIDKISFEIQNNRGGLTDFRNLSLVIGSEEVDFNQNGFLTIRTRNLRLADGESQNLSIELKVNDKNAVSQLGGSFRLKLKGITASNELDFQSVPVKISGQTVSNNIIWNPLSFNTNSGLGTASFSSQTIYGKALSAGEKSFILSLRLNASFEDLLLKKITVRNAYGSGVDNKISRINLIDLDSGQILSQRKMINGKAVFDLRSNVAVARNNFINLGFQVEVKDDSSQIVGDNRLKLDINASDIEMYGYGSGQEIPDSRKNITLTTETFTLNQGGGITAGFESSQPQLFSTGSKNEVIRFFIKNKSSQKSSLGRISFQVGLNGVEFTGGLSLDDADIREFYNGRLINSTLFTLSNTSGNILTFDADDQIYLNPGQTRTFGLSIALTNIPSSADDNDAVNIQILGDSSASQGTLSQLRTAGKQFIWSDYSGKPHVPGAFDWFSGYLVEGIPTNTIRNKRD